MEHFPIIQALCRTVLADANPATRKQVERLRDALKKGGESKQAGAIATLLTAAERSKEISPSRLERSKAHFLGGEALTRNTPVPVDKETSAPLADILFPSDQLLEKPLFNNTVSEAIRSIIEEWTHFEVLSEYDVTPSRSCLMYGAPGTGKTHLALWMAQQLGLPVVLVKLDGLVSSFLGTTARNIGNLFSFANRFKCVLLLDEFDAIAKVRDDPQEVGEIKRVVNALLQNLDARRDIGYTIGITNHSKLLDPAVWRRFEVQIEIPKPDFEIRTYLAKHFMTPHMVPESHLKMMAWFTEGATGAEIESLVRTYKKSLAIREGDRSDILDTLRRFATLNAARVNPLKRALLFEDQVALLKAMHDDDTLGMSMADLGEITGKDKSTVSRQIGKTAVKTADGDAANG